MPSDLNWKFWKKKHPVNNNFHGIEIQKAEDQNTKPGSVGFFNLHYAKLRMLELCYIFVNKRCKSNKFGGMEMDTDFFCVVFAAKEPTECLRKKIKEEWEKLRWNGCISSLTMTHQENITKNLFCRTQIKTSPRKVGSLRRRIQMFKNSVFVVKLIVATILHIKSWNSEAKTPLTQ